jgi:hypothetical protein
MCCAAAYGRHPEGTRTHQNNSVLGLLQANRLRGQVIAYVLLFPGLIPGLMQSHENTSRSWRDDTLPDMIAVIGRIILK